MSPTQPSADGWLRMDEAAQRLGVTPQVLWNRLAARGAEVRRSDADGRAVSLVRACDVGLAAPAAALEDDDDGGVGTSVWSQLHELRTERDLLERTLARVLAEQREREELQAQQWSALGIELDDLRARHATAERDADEWRRRSQDLDVRLAGSEAELRAARSERDALQRAAEGEAGRAAEIAREREGELQAERQVRVRLERELALARELESANERYLDQLELKLRAAQGARRAG